MSWVGGAEATPSTDVASGLYGVEFLPRTPIARPALNGAPKSADRRESDEGSGAGADPNTPPCRPEIPKS